MKNTWFKELSLNINRFNKLVTLYKSIYRMFDSGSLTLILYTIYSTSIMRANCNY